MINLLTYRVNTIDRPVCVFMCLNEVPNVFAGRFTRATIFVVYRSQEFRVRQHRVCKSGRFGWQSQPEKASLQKFRTVQDISFWIGTVWCSCRIRPLTGPPDQRQTPNWPWFVSLCLSLLPLAKDRNQEDWMQLVGTESRPFALWYLNLLLFKSKKETSV